MTEFSGPIGGLTQRRLRFCLTLLSSLACLALLLAVRPARAEEPDEAYLSIYAQVQEAESLEASGQSAQALTNYQRVAAALKVFQRNYPAWNAKMVNQRMNRLTEKLTALAQKPPTPAPPRTNAPAGAPATNSASPTAASAEGAVTVLQPGAEPRKALRLHPKAGAKQTVETTLTMSSETKMGAMETPAIKLPPMTMLMEMSVKSVSPDGDITFEIVVKEAKVAEAPGSAAALVEMANASLAGAKGVSGTCTVSDRGVSKGLDFKMAKSPDQQSRQMAEQMGGACLTLPEEAVGPGAKWEVRKVSKAQGYPINETDSYELVAVEGDRLTVKFSVALSAANQKLQNPTTGRTASKMEVVKMTGTGSGELSCDLGLLMPTKVSSKQHMDTTVLVGAPQKQTVIQKMDLETRIQAK
jgi:hypothetical protein